MLGVGLRCEELSVARARAALSARHCGAIAEALLLSAARQRDGAKERVENTVAALTGCPAHTFRAWAQDHAPLFGAVGRQPASAGGERD